MFCPKCGGKNPDEAKFCKSCGQSLVRAVKEEKSEPKPEATEGKWPVSRKKPILKVIIIAVSSILILGLGNIVYLRITNLRREQAYKAAFKGKVNLGSYQQTTERETERRQARIQTYKTFSLAPGTSLKYPSDWEILEIWPQFGFNRPVFQKRQEFSLLITFNNLNDQLGYFQRHVVEIANNPDFVSFITNEIDERGAILEYRLKSSYPPILSGHPESGEMTVHHRLDQIIKINDSWLLEVEARTNNEEEWPQYQQGINDMISSINIDLADIKL